MSHHLTVIINNGFLSTLLGVHIGSTRVALREREFQWHLPGIRWGGIISWAHFSSCSSFHPPLFIIAQYCVHSRLTKKLRVRKMTNRLEAFCKQRNHLCCCPSRSGRCSGPLQRFMQVLKCPKAYSFWENSAVVKVVCSQRMKKMLKQNVKTKR